MPAAVDISQDIKVVIASVTAFASAAPGERTQLAARWREYLREGRAGLQRQADLFEGLYQDTISNNHLRAVEHLAEATLDQRQEEAKRIEPLIQILVEYLSAHSGDPELSLVFSEALEILRGTLKNFDALHNRLIAFASSRADPNKILRARPIEGEVDHAALSREFIARFPKIRAALAK